MLRSLKDLEQYTVTATNGDIGRVADFLLDDDRWGVRYLVVETGSFFDGRQVLISPISFRLVEWATQRFHLALTVDKVKNSPNVDVDKPVSRQVEQDYHHYYGYPNYWASSGPWGTGWLPVGAEAKGEHPHTSGDVHLHSAKEVRGYHIQGRDEAIGHVEDFIIDDVSWAVRYLVIDTKNWWFGKKVLVAPAWTTRVSWSERTVYVDMSRQAIKNSPEWDPDAAVNREYEVRLYDYYGRPVYWGGDEPAVPPPPPPAATTNPG